MTKLFRELTIIEIEKMKGVRYEGIIIESTLTIWYDQLRLKRLCDLTDGDIARCIRQEIFLDYTIDEALYRIALDPFVGEQYDGEILINLAELDKDFWTMNTDIFKKVKHTIKNIDHNLIESFEWLSIEEKTEYCNVIRSLLNAFEKMK